MKGKPRVSLLVTVYNREAYLAEALESIAAQTFGDFECLVWDDGSTDGTESIARDFARRDPRFRIFTDDHAGRLASLQRVTSLAKGSYIGWVDSDDRLEPEALADTLAILDQHPDVGLVYTDYWEMDARGRNIGFGRRCRLPYSPDGLLTDFMVFHFRLFRREVFELAGGLRNAVALAEDYDLCLRVSEVTRFYHHRRPLYRYRIHEDSLSHKRRLAQIYATREAIQWALVRRGMVDRFEVQLSLHGQYHIRMKPALPVGAA